VGVVEEGPRYADSGGVKIAYQVHGHGVDLVMVPGFVSHVELQWREAAFRRFVRSLARVARVVRFDKRGTGLSDPVTTVPTLQDRMADLTAVIDAAGCRQPFLFGFSEGGPIAIQLAVARPEMVRGLVLYGTSPLPPPGWAVEQLRAAVDHWGEGHTGPLFAPGEPEHARGDRGAFERASASPAMARALVDSLANVDVTGLLCDVTVPTLVVHRRDEFIPVAHAEMMAAHIPGARLVLLEGEDHLPWLGDSDQIVAEVSRFIAATADQERGVSSPRASSSPRPPSGWASLSPAERRVALLVAEGLSNVEVSHRLFISRYTVETHLKRIFAKLGIASRTELAAVVFRNT
jgi:pimeloyl-ACP methyl ester carboxylesterase/DNA-binding CsgD family transcriptional regulator